MTENEPVRSPSSGNEHPLSGSDLAATAADLEIWTWQKFRWYVARATAVLGALALLGVTAFGFSGWYTSRPQFCRSCHIMEPYYVSWQHSSHKDVSCVKCHFPPGAGEKLRGKMLGLVQLIKYVTESQGPRPTAEIPDASCLRSGCHDTRLLSGRIDFQGIPFDHGPHLAETRRGKQLRCTSCHSQIVQGSHMTVTDTTCFLCHFKDQHFNESLGTCTRCHQIPEKDFELGGGITFNHDLAYERGVNCASCHDDLIRGNGEVPVERCSVCHNREDDLKRIDDHEFMHQIHVADHKVDCMSCHLAIHHSIDTQKVSRAASDCASCHPNHHQSQVQLIEGVGAKTVQPQLNSMTAVRISCPSCHRQMDVSSTGAPVWKASLDSCLGCHELETAQKLMSYQNVLSTSLADVETTIGRVREALVDPELPAERVTAISTQLDNLQHDVTFLRVGNGVHNIHYADTLTRALVEQLTSLCDELQLDKPEITLPEASTSETDTEPDDKTPDTPPEQTEPLPSDPEAATEALEEEPVEPVPPPEPDETQ